jgi:radical SAM superfamily enzyme YgiQ (UPF0313 family)
VASQLPDPDQVTIGLVQINNSFSGQNYLPYSIACLESFVQAHAPRPDRYRFLTPIYKRMPIDRIVDHLIDADIAGFSTYVWNAEISLEVARRLKHRRPDITILFGGPQVPDHPEAFLRQHPFIDLAVHNEGEQTFLDFLEQWPQGDRSTLLGVSYVEAGAPETGDPETGAPKPADRFVKAPPAPRFRDLDKVPSPFLNGMFDALIRQNPEESWIGLWETNRGCPFQCTFCDWGSATAGKVTKFELDRLTREIDWFAEKKIEYVFVCDANFGIQKRDVEIAQHVAEVKARTGYPHGFSVQNTKNATERAYQTQKILADAGLNKGVALSMQSIDPVTLKNIKRDNISLDTYLELARRFTRDRVETYSDLILGLPGETYESFCNGVNTLIEAGQHNRIQFNNLSILPNAEMGNPDYIRQFGMVTVRSEIINIHGSREELDDDVPEFQDLVVATASMPPADWRRTRSFAWMTAFLHFDKLFQMPLIVTHELTGIPYRAMIDAFVEADAAVFPVIAGIRDFFIDSARTIQEGEPEYLFSKEWLGVFWPADEYAFIKLTVEGKIDGFYEEAHRLLEATIADTRASLPDGLLGDAVRLNRALLSQPFVADDIEITTGFDILSFCDGVRTGERQPLRRQPTALRVLRGKARFDRIEDWCRQVVWWGNKKGAYLYSNQSLQPERQLAGHF